MEQNMLLIVYQIEIEIHKFIADCGRIDPLQPPVPRLSSPRQTGVITDLLVARFLDVFSPDPRFHSDTPRAFRLAASAAVPSRLLYHAFQAVSLALFGKASSNKSVERVAGETYGGVLKDLQRSLYDPEDSKSMEVLITVGLMFIFEGIWKTDANSVLRHLSGILKLVEHRGPKSHISGIDHVFFNDMRFYLVATALTSRKSTLLSTQEWKIIPWSANPETKDVVQLVLDEALQVPPYLEEYDRFQRALKTRAPDADIGPLRKALCSRVSKIEQSLYQWYEYWVENYPSGPPSERVPEDESSFPIFRCRDNSKSTIIVPTVLIYPDVKLALAHCMFYAVVLIVSANDPREIRLTGPEEQYDFACRICRSMEFCLRTFPGQAVNRLGFPLKVAYSYFPDGIEREYVKLLSAFIANHRNIRWWDNMKVIYT
ncbi:conserved hypothetical protein [Paecilomyces variotii No. 5]|uniref:C6 finger domain protein n=1 Tax=Byssochlamys spectabilis (strain No. 5 / NBRC 109023) TaxID=1356009 RepID=V5G1H4_BYSSN|nr:conserved hypothetical protein [Paecilomyces variotii No. 5]